MKEDRFNRSAQLAQARCGFPKRKDNMDLDGGSPLHSSLTVGASAPP